MKIYTIGHSTRNLEEFVEILKKFQIELLIDIRKFPSSRKFPHFNRESLESELGKHNICYIHYPELGGFRKESYKVFAQTEEFENAIKELLKIINSKNAAIACAEIVPFRCHRKYVAHKLSELGHQVVHIINKEKTIEHKIESKEIQEKMKSRILCDRKIS